MAKPQINIDIKPIGIESAYIVAPFDEGKEALVKVGYNIISLEENARLRIQEGADADISKNGNWVREGVLYIPKKGVFLTKYSPIIANAKEATNCHRDGKEFYLTTRQVEESLSDSVELSVKSVPTDRFADCDITVFAFGDTAKQYGEFLEKQGINEMPIYLSNLEDKPFARQLWFGRLDRRSGFLGDRGLYYDDSARGVRKSAEGTAKNFKGQIKTPNIAEILNYTKRFVPEAVRDEFEKGLAKKLNQ